MISGQLSCWRVRGEDNRQTSAADGSVLGAAGESTVQRDSSRQQRSQGIAVPLDRRRPTPAVVTKLRRGSQRGSEDEQHLLIRRKWPEVIGDVILQQVSCQPNPVHRRQQRVATELCSHHRVGR